MARACRACRACSACREWLVSAAQRCTSRRLTLALTLTLTLTLTPTQLNERVRGLQLSETLHANKLAVCLGDGSRYDTHYDNMGGDDLRKLTALLYLQREWTVEHGGCFRMFTRQEGSV